MRPAPNVAASAEDWWPAPVQAIYRDALAALVALGRDEDALLYGPGHIVWADSNFEDEHIDFCLAECDARPQDWGTVVTGPALAVVRRSLERLRAVPEAERGDDPYCDD